MSKKFYNKKFYEDRSDSVKSAEHIVPYLLELFDIKSVVDIGCGDGSFLSVFEKNKITNILGIDGEWVDEEYLRISKENFEVRNFEEAFDIRRNFDLAISLEVAEHISKENAPSFIQSITKLAPIVLFSAAIPYQGGSHHVNEQWPQYWVNLFKKYNFVPIDSLRKKFWNNPDVSYWYSQNMLLFVRETSLKKNDSLSKLFTEDSEKEILPLVHPTHYMQKAKVWNFFWNLTPKFIKNLGSKKVK